MHRGPALADPFRAADLEECFAVPSTTAQERLHQLQQQGLLVPSRPGRRIRSWQLWEPWLAWVTGQHVWEK